MQFFANRPGTRLAFAWNTRTVIHSICSWPTLWTGSVRLFFLIFTLSSRSFCGLLIFKIICSMSPIKVLYIFFSIKSDYSFRLVLSRSWRKSNLLDFPSWTGKLIGTGYGVWSGFSSFSVVCRIVVFLVSWSLVHVPVLVDLPRLCSFVPQSNCHWQLLSPCFSRVGFEWPNQVICFLGPIQVHSPYTGLNFWVLYFGHFFDPFTLEDDEFYICLLGLSVSALRAFRRRIYRWWNHFVNIYKDSIIPVPMPTPKDLESVHCYVFIFWTFLYALQNAKKEKKFVRLLVVLKKKPTWLEEESKVDK